MRTRWRIPHIAICILVVGCRPAIVWLEEGSTSDNLVFGLAERRGGNDPVHDLHEISVTGCPAQSGDPAIPLWRAEGRQPEGERPPLFITYGAPPPGFRNVTEPAVLPAGCYETSISGGGISSTVRFELRPNGDAVELYRAPGS